MRKIESPSDVENPPPLLRNTFLPYLLKAVLAFGAIIVSSRFIDSFGVWLFYSLSLVLAVPITIRLAYFRAIRRTHNLSVFDSNSWMRRFLSGVVLRLIVSLMIGMVLAFVAVFRLRALEWQEWVTCAVAIPVFWAIAYGLAPVFAQQFAPLFRVVASVKSASWLSMLTMLLIYCGLTMAFPSELTPLNGNAGQITSATVEELAALHDGWRKLEAFVLGHLSDHGELGRIAALMVFVLGNVSFFYSWASILAFLCIPRSEISRAFCRPTTQVERPIPSAAGIAWGTAVFVILTVCFFQTAAIIEGNLAQQPPGRRPVKSFVEKVEKIGSQFYRPGTIRKLRDAEADWKTSQKVNVGILEREINRVFDHMEGNVDEFLDWYYSLPAEYARLGKLLAGDFEAYILEKFHSIVGREEQFEDLARTFSSMHESGRAYEDKLEKILSENSIMVNDPSRVTVMAEIEDINWFKMRGLLSAGIAMPGVVGGVIAGKTVAAGVSKVVTAKIMATGILKIAAKAAAKVAATKLVAGSVGATVGSTIGMVAGSVVPIAGTATGAVVGGFIGALVVGVGADKMLLELQEYMNRSEFRDALIKELNQERQRMLNAVKPSATEGRENEPPSSRKTKT